MYKYVTEGSAYFALCHIFFANVMVVPYAAYFTIIYIHSLVLTAYFYPHMFVIYVTWQCIFLCQNFWYMGLSGHGFKRGYGANFQVNVILWCVTYVVQDIYVVREKNVLFLHEIYLFIICINLQCQINSPSESH